MTRQRVIEVLAIEGYAVDPLVDAVIALYAAGSTVFEIHDSLAAREKPLSLATIICILFLTYRWKLVHRNEYCRQWAAFKASHKDNWQAGRACPPYPSFDITIASSLPAKVKYGVYPAMLDTVNAPIADSLDERVTSFLKMNVDLSLKEIARRQAVEVAARRERADRAAEKAAKPSPPADALATGSAERSTPKKGSGRKHNNTRKPSQQSSKKPAKK